MMETPRIQTSETAVPTVVDRVKGKIHGFTEKLRKYTYKGRKEEYMKKYGDCVTHAVSGEERYRLRHQMEEDAKKYARGKILQEALVAAGIAAGTAGAVWAGKEGIQGRNPIKTLGKFASSVGEGAKRNTIGALISAGHAVGKGFHSAEKAVNTVVQTAVVEPIHEAVDNQTRPVQIVALRVKESFYGALGKVLRHLVPKKS